MRTTKVSKSEIGIWMQFLADCSDKPGAQEMAAQFAVRKRGPIVNRTPREGLEKAAQNRIRKALSLHPAVSTCVRYNSGRYGDRGQYSFNSANGHSDLHGELNGGRAYYIEVKRKGSYLTLSQAQFLLTKYEAGALVGVARIQEDAIRIVEGKYTEADLRAEFELAS
jgi:hypothetical protein